jgi:hypothetical protein
VSGSKLGGSLKTALDLLVHGFLLSWLPWMREFGIRQNAAHCVQQARLLNGQGTQQRIDDPLLSKKASVLGGVL